MAGRQAMRLDPAWFCDRVRLETALDTPDGQGGVTRSFVTVTSLWAHVEPLSVSSQERQAQRRQIGRTRILIRHRGDVVPGQRLVWRERVFRIETVSDPDMTGRYLGCDCVEGEGEADMQGGTP